MKFLLPYGRTVAAGSRTRPSSAIAFIDDELLTKLMLEQAAREAGMSKFHFCRYFNAVTGLTFREVWARRRIARAIELLRDEQLSLTEVYLDGGFKDLSHSGRAVRKRTGQSPSRFRYDDRAAFPR